MLNPVKLYLSFDTNTLFLDELMIDEEALEQSDDHKKEN